jgi:hypothetical protein
MATSPNPLGGAQGGPAPAGAAPPTPGATPGGMSPSAAAPLPQKLARLAMDAQAIAGESPETAPMMREIQNQVRMAMMKMIQQKQAAQQTTPPI